VPKLRRVPKDKKTGIPKAYLKNTKNKAAKAAEIKRTAAKYKAGEYIDIRQVQQSRVNQDATKKPKKAVKRANKKNTKKKSRRK
tara:strand:- start:110 stop:361 length:252 start_codon:yes stop_codon:yes gene_type:complete